MTAGDLYNLLNLIFFNKIIIPQTLYKRDFHALFHHSDQIVWSSKQHESSNDLRRVGCGRGRWWVGAVTFNMVPIALIKEYNEL